MMFDCFLETADFGYAFLSDDDDDDDDESFVLRWKNQ